MEAGAAALIPPGARPSSEGAVLGKRGTAHRQSSVEDMYARGSVIQPSPKLLGLMEIHERGNSFSAG